MQHLRLNLVRSWYKKPYFHLILAPPTFKTTLVATKHKTNLITSYLEVALLYQNRWQIEVFFRWIRQNLVIKKFWEYSENAVKIHLWIAVIAYLLVAYAKQILKSDYSVYEIMQVVIDAEFTRTKKMRSTYYIERISSLHFLKKEITASHSTPQSFFPNRGGSKKDSQNDYRRQHLPLVAN